jgi:hypothetical protein
MKKTLYTPQGVIEIDTDTVTDEELATLGIQRNDLPRDWRAELAQQATILGRLNIIEEYLGLK